jgi:hypothetical protein
MGPARNASCGPHGSALAVTVKVEAEARDQRGRVRVRDVCVDHVVDHERQLADVEVSVLVLRTMGCEATYLTQAFHSPI